MDIKNDSRTNGLSLSTIDCQACVLRPSCESIIYIILGDVVLSPDMDACKTIAEQYIATIKLAPPLNQVLQNVSFGRLKFPSYSIGAARKSILESVYLERTEIPDVRRMDPETLQKTDWTNCSTLYFSQSCNSSCTRQLCPGKIFFPNLKRINPTFSIFV